MSGTLSPTRICLFAFILLVNIFRPGTSYAQFERSYAPVKVSTPLPETYFRGMDEKAKSLAGQQTILEKSVAEKFYLQTLGSLKKLFLDGDIFYDDELTKYVTQVAQKTFAGKPDALNGISFYVSRFPHANAYTYPDGTILINIGLLALLDNEAQLAFIIAHEVGHFNKKHSLDAYSKKLSLAEQKNDTETEKIAFLNLSYSREHESDADGYAINILSNSGYNANQSGLALDYLGKEDTSLAKARANCFAWFSNENFQVDSSWIKAGNKFKPFGNKTSSSSIFNGDLDNLSSHPSFEKRIIAINEMLKNIEYVGQEKALNLVIPDYMQIKRTAQFESAKVAYDDGEYFLSILYTGELLNLYPENDFAATLMLKNLYWAAYYKDVTSLKHLETDLPIYKRGEYWMIGQLFKKADAASTKKLAYGFAKKNQKLFEKNDEFSFYLALTVDQYLGRETANIFYNQYQSRFMNGQYITVVNQKLEQK